MADNDIEGFVDLAQFQANNVSKEVIMLSQNLTSPKRSVMIDTQYLIQVNKEELTSILLDPNYEITASSPLKQQMSRLFKNSIERKLDLCFSNNIMREFIGLVAKKRDLLEIYKRNIVVISPKAHFEPCFMDLSAAIGSRMLQSKCGNGDVKDTYSYLLAALARINFFVTEDQDIKRLYHYFSIIKAKPSNEKALEIAQIDALYRELSIDTEFPLEPVLNFLFSENAKEFTVPVSIAQLQNSLPLVLDKFENIIWIYRSIDELQFLMMLINKLPSNWDYSVIDNAKKRIGQIAKSIGFQTDDRIDEYTLKTKLIEQERNWSQQSTDEDIVISLDSQFNILQNIIYEEETANSIEYASLEEYFTAKEEAKVYTVKCKKCYSVFELEINYNGTTDRYQREMGVELTHEWTGEEECPNCSSEVSLTYQLYEYPEGAENDEDTECSGCEVVTEKPSEKPPSTTLNDFM